MKILVCSDSFKGSLSSGEISSIIRQNILLKFPKTEIKCVDIADGGEGSLNAINSSTFYDTKTHQAVDPLMRKLDSYFLLNKRDGTAIIELAMTGGLSLLDESEQNCCKTTTYGLGLQIKEALKYEPQTCDIMIGGSSTNDLGLGMAAALGYKFFAGSERINFPTGHVMNSITKIIPPDEMNTLTKFNVICDVKNILLGPSGAAFTYGRQKGANEKELIELEEGAKNIVRLIDPDHKLNHELKQGSGAAGGVGYGALAFLGAKVKSGVNYMINVLKIEDQMIEADLVITGEGKIDEQTLYGKLVYGITQLGKKTNTKVVAVCALNELNKEQLAQISIDNTYSLYQSAPQTISKSESKDRLALICEEIIRDYLQ